MNTFADIAQWVTLVIFIVSVLWTVRSGHLSRWRWPDQLTYACLLLFIAPVIGYSWLGGKQLPPWAFTTCVAGIGVCVAIFTVRSLQFLKHSREELVRMKAEMDATYGRRHTDKDNDAD